MSLPERLAFIDLETTGANPLRDRITEIAVVRVERGEVVARWESLINPGIPIPPMIQSLIGISDAMVARAPAFADIAGELRALLADCVFAAHNARFDYGFIRNAYAMLGEDFDAPVLCTVKLSRALYPEHHRHGLDAIIERHALVCGARHRAMGDAAVLWDFAQLVQESFAADVLERAVTRAMKAPARPPGLPEGAVEGMPDAPGVYLFYGEGTAPLYIARAVSVRARVMEQFAAAARNEKEARITREVRRVEWIETAGELGAMLLEARLLREEQPRHNRLPSREEPFALRLIPNRKRPPIFERVPVAGTDPARWAGLHGVFRARKEADAMLRELAMLYRLCPRRLGLEPNGTGPCPACVAKRCAGVCAGRETAAAHDARLAGALTAASLKRWPWPGQVVIAERHEESGREAFHLVDRWCHLGTADSREALAALRASAPECRFDIDAWRIIGRWLAARPETVEAL